MRQRRLTTAGALAFAVVFALALHSAAIAQTTQSGPPPPTTPFQLNPFLFSNETDATRALSSPDVLMRQSGVEWLGRWTGTDGWSPPPDADATQKSLRGRSDLVPLLIRAVEEMPEQDGAQATTLLALIGNPARQAIPAVCDAMYRWEGVDFVASAHLLNGLVHLCGGPDKLASGLIPFLRDNQTTNRLAIARGLRYCADPTFEYLSPPPNGAYPTMSMDHFGAWQSQFQAQVVPALARTVGDRDSAVRIAAMESLEHISHDFQEDVTPSVISAWQTTVKPLAHMASWGDPVERVATLKVLAVEPSDVSSGARVLRGNLQGNADERLYALEALCHAVQTNPKIVVNVFLADWNSADPTKRQIAADDMNQAAVPLWAGIPPANIGVPWFNDSRLVAYTSKIRLDTVGMQAEMQNVHDRILAALVNAESDSDQKVRASAAAALVQISQQVSNTLGAVPVDVVNGRVWPGGENLEAKVTTALDTAADILKQTDPDLAKRLQDQKLAFKHVI